MPALLEALKDEAVGLEAAYTLGKLGPAAVPALIEVFKGGHGDVRWRAAVALGQLGPGAKTAMPALVEALKDTDIKVRQTAAIALGEIGPDAESAVPALISALEDPEEDVRSNAAWALGKIGPEAKAAVPVLIKTLKEKYVGGMAAESLGKIGPPAVPALVEALKDKNKDVGRYAARALGEIGPDAKPAVPALIEAIKDKHVRWPAVEALGKLAPALRAAKAIDIVTITNLKAAEKALSAKSDSKKEENKLRQVIEYLETNLIVQAAGTVNLRDKPPSSLFYRLGDIKDVIKADEKVKVKEIKEISTLFGTYIWIDVERLGENIQTNKRNGWAYSGERGDKKHLFRSLVEGI